jgi:hypothetical protein
MLMASGIVLCGLGFATLKYRLFEQAPGSLFFELRRAP